MDYCCSARSTLVIGFHCLPCQQLVDSPAAGGGIGRHRDQPVDRPSQINPIKIELQIGYRSDPALPTVRFQIRLLDNEQQVQTWDGLGQVIIYQNLMSFCFSKETFQRGSTDLFSLSGNGLFNGLQGGTLDRKLACLFSDEYAPNIKKLMILLAPAFFRTISDSCRVHLQ